MYTFMRSEYVHKSIPYTFIHNSKIWKNLDIYEKENGPQMCNLHTMEHYTTIKQQCCDYIKEA